MYLLFNILEEQFPKAFDFIPGEIKELLRYIAGFGITIIIGIRYRKKHGMGALPVFFPKTGIINILVILAATVCLGSLVEPVVSAIPVPQAWERILEDAFLPVLNDPFLSILSFVAAPAILEELVFRGIILDSFLKNYKPGKAIVISALLFGIFHLNPWQLITGFILGLFMGWIYWKTRSLLLCMLIHGIHNFSMLAQYWNTREFTDSMHERLGKQNFVLFYLATIIVFIGCMRTLNRRLNGQNSNNGSQLPL